MAADEFFNRWKAQNDLARQARAAAQAEAAAEAAAPPPAVDPWQDRLPTLEDVQQASATDSDFSPFMKQGVDESVKRSALKKLFTDPQFNVMDGLDIYIGDYTQSDPIPPEMMAMLNHAKSLFDPPGMHGHSVMAMQESTPVVDPAGAPTATGSVPEAGAGEVDGANAEASAQANASANAGVEPPPEAGAEPATAVDPDQTRLAGQANQAGQDSQADQAHQANHGEQAGQANQTGQPASQAPAAPATGLSAPTGRAPDAASPAPFTAHGTLPLSHPRLHETPPK